MHRKSIDFFCLRIWDSIEVQVLSYLQIYQTILRVYKCLLFCTIQDHFSLREIRNVAFLIPSPRGLES